MYGKIQIAVLSVSDMRGEFNLVKCARDFTQIHTIEPIVEGMMMADWRREVA